MRHEVPDVAKALPHNIEAEQAMLGAVFINNAAYDVVSPFLKADHFFDPFHKRLWTVIGQIFESGKKANPVTLKHFINADKQITSDMTAFQYPARPATEATPE